MLKNKTKTVKPEKKNTVLFTKPRRQKFTDVATPQLNLLFDKHKRRQATETLFTKDFLRREFN